MSNPDVYGFVKDLSGWLLPIAAFVLGNATKGGANQAKLDAVVSDVASVKAQLQDNTITITTHTALIAQSVTTANTLIQEMKENRELLWRIAEKSGVTRR